MQYQQQPKLNWFWTVFVIAIKLLLVISITSFVKQRTCSDLEIKESLVFSRGLVFFDSSPKGR